MKELFDIKSVKRDSPRLAWMREKKISLFATGYIEGDEDEFGSEMFPFYAFVGGDDFSNVEPRNAAGGSTEDDAVANLAVKKGWRLWNEETTQQPFIGRRKNE